MFAPLLAAGLLAAKGTAELKRLYGAERPAQ